MRWLRSCVLLFCLIGAASAHALTPADALALAQGDGDTRIATLNRLAAEPDERAFALMQALADGAVKVLDERVLIVGNDGSTTDAITGAAVPASDEAQDAIVNNRMRGALEVALAARALLGTDAAAQRDAAQLLQRAAFDEPDDSQIPLINKALAGTLDDTALASR